MSEKCPKCGYCPETTTTPVMVFPYTWTGYAAPANESSVAANQGNSVLHYTPSSS